MNMKSMTKTSVLKIGFLLAALILFAGLSAAALAATPKKKEAVVAEAAKSASDSAYTLVISGSDTVQPIIGKVVGNFKEAHKNVDIIINYSNSTEGINGLINGNVDIAMASREMSKGELDLAKKKGVNPTATVIAYDGVAIVANRSNVVNDLTQVQLADIFSGVIRNWSQVGGEDVSINVMTREQGSGTFVFFNKIVLNNVKLKGIDMRPVEDNKEGYSALIQAVGDVDNAIGYVSFGRLQRLRKIKILKIDGIEPTITTIANKSYKLSRPLYLYTNGRPSAAAQKIIDYILSPEGQKLAEEFGFAKM